MIKKFYNDFIYFFSGAVVLGLFALSVYGENGLRLSDGSLSLIFTMEISLIVVLITLYLCRYFGVKKYKKSIKDKNNAIYVFIDYKSGSIFKAKGKDEANIFIGLVNDTDSFENAKDLNIARNCYY